MSLRGPLNSLKTHMREILEEYHIRLINIRNKNSFSDTTCYEVFYETNFKDPQFENIMGELEQLCPEVDFEFDATSYDVKTVSKAIRKHIRTKFRHRVLLMATQEKSSDG